MNLDLSARLHYDDGTFSYPRSLRGVRVESIPGGIAIHAAPVRFFTYQRKRADSLWLYVNDVLWAVLDDDKYDFEIRWDNFQTVIWSNRGVVELA